MTKPVKILLLLATLSPFALVFLFIASFIYLINTLPPKEIEPFFNDHAIVVSLLNLLVTAFFGAIWVFYIVHAARNPNIPAMRVTWIIALVILGPWVMPFYWYHHIWREGVAKPVRGSLGL
jgi:hypothetical protein